MTTRTKKVFTGLFKRLICFPIWSVIFIITFPGSVVTLALPHLIYWMITGRTLCRDCAALFLYTFSLPKDWLDSKDDWDMNWP